MTIRYLYLETCRKPREQLFPISYPNVTETMKTYKRAAQKSTSIHKTNRITTGVSPWHGDDQIRRQDFYSIGLLCIIVCNSCHTFDIFNFPESM